jgi:hypothetical protein
MGYKDSEGNDLEAFNDPKKVRELVDAIRKLESADGKLLNHRTIASGEQEGMRAVGQYGFTPVGFFDAARVLGKREKDEELKNLGSIVQSDSRVPNEDKQMLLENLIKARPDIEERLIRDLASRLLVRQQGNIGKAAAAYEGNPFQALISDEKLAANPRTERLKSQFGKDYFPKSEEQPLEETEEELLRLK